MTTFILTGFSQELGVRVFSYERIAKDRPRTTFRVRADLATARGYNLKLQDLPLLCRVLLEATPEDTSERTLTYTATEMADQARLRDRAGAARRFKRPPRRPTP